MWSRRGDSDEVDGGGWKDSESGAGFEREWGAGATRENNGWCGRIGGGWGDAGCLLCGVSEGYSERER